MAGTVDRAQMDPAAVGAALRPAGTGVDESMANLRGAAAVTVVHWTDLGVRDAPGPAKDIRITLRDGAAGHRPAPTLGSL